MSTHPKEIFKKHRLSVDDYHRMGEVGILKQQDRVELIEGEIVDMVPIGSNHSGTVTYLSNVLTYTLQNKAIVMVQNPIQLSRFNEPQPDLIIATLREDFYRKSHPTPDDIHLIVEVADTSLKYDKEFKIPLYAKFNIPHVWLVDLENKKLVCFSSPDNGQYQKIQDLDVNSQIELYFLPEQKIDLSKLF